MSAPPLRDGDLVTLFGLTRRDDLNGITGSLLKMAVAAPAVRWLVQMRDSDEVVSVLEANIILATDYDTDDGWKNEAEGGAWDQKTETLLAKAVTWEDVAASQA